MENSLEYVLYQTYKNFDRFDVAKYFYLDQKKMRLNKKGFEDEFIIDTNDTIINDT